MRLADASSSAAIREFIDQTDFQSRFAPSVKEIAVAPALDSLVHQGRRWLAFDKPDRTLATLQMGSHT